MADVHSNVDPETKLFLGKEMYLVVTRPVRSPEIAKRLGDHLAHQIELEKRGIMFASGPLYPRGSETPEAACSCPPQPPSDTPTPPPTQTPRTDPHSHP